MLQPPPPPAPARAPSPPSPPTPATPQAPAIASGTVQPTPMGNLLPGMPLTERQHDQILEQRSALSDQLISASGRRDEAAAALRGTTGADREGLEQRLRQLDARILQLEADIEYTGRLISAAEPVAEQNILVPPPFSRDNFPGRGMDMTPIAIVFTLFVLAPLAIALARLLWKRATTSRAPAPSLESGQRMERVEQAIDSIAVEVERISEGQRFVTRILTEGSAQSVLNAGQRADALGAQRRDAIKVPRDGQ